MEMRIGGVDAAPGDSGGTVIDALKQSLNPKSTFDKGWPSRFGKTPKTRRKSGNITKNLYFG